MAPSCVGLDATCGFESNSSCCERTVVSGGAFNRSNDAAHPATVSEFRLETYEVTVARFRAFVRAFEHGYRPMDGTGKNLHNADDPGWQQAWTDALPADGASLTDTVTGVRCEPPFGTWTDVPGANENRPINCLTWYVAQAFCIWDGGRLPTEAEWNYAAAAGEAQRVFPWSDPANATTISDSYASYWVDATLECSGDGMIGCAVTDLVAAGSKPNGLGHFGQADLAGNVWEWVRDTSGPYPSDCSDCANLTAGTERVARGGGYASNSFLLETAFRGAFSPTYRSSGIGVRCARDGSERR